MKLGWMMVLSDALIKKKLFLVRPRPIKDEGVAEFLQRLAKANGLASVSVICNLLQVPLNEIVVSGHAKLQAVIHGDANAISLRHPERSHHSISPYRDQLGVSKYARVCISCLKESDLLNSAWSEPLAISCERHRERLLDQCPSCLRLILRTGSQYRCQCGQGFGELKPLAAPFWESSFQEIFTPWKMPAHKPILLANSDRLELHAARLLRKIINASRHSTPLSNASLAKTRIFTSDYSVLEKTSITDLDFSSLWEKPPSQAKKFKREWQKQAEPCSIPAPKILGLLSKEAKRKSEINFQKTMQRRQLKILHADSISNIARIIDCQFKTAARLLANKSWCADIKRSVPATLHDQSIFASLRAVIDATFSIQETTKKIGIPRSWKGHFARFASDSIKINPEYFPAWRFPQKHLENLTLQLHKCRLEAQSVASFPEGFLRIAEIPRGAVQLQIWVQDQLKQGVLQLTYEDSSTKLQLIDFSIPLTALSKGQFSYQTRNLIKRLTQFPEESNKSPSGRVHAVPD